jgi:hypothetical protein
LTVTLSITDESNAHRQEQNHQIMAKKVGQAGGEMSKVLKVLASAQGGDSTPGPHRFKLRAARVDKNSHAAIAIQADKNISGRDPRGGPRVHPGPRTVDEQGQASRQRTTG